MVAFVHGYFQYWKTGECVSDHEGEVEGGKVGGLVWKHDALKSSKKPIKTIGWVKSLNTKFG